LRKLPCEEWEVFKKEPIHWKKSMRLKDEMIAEKIRLDNLYNAYDPNLIEHVKAAFR